MAERSARIVNVDGRNRRPWALQSRERILKAAIDEIAEVGFDPLYGARPLKRAIQAEIENPLAKQILEGSFGPKDTIVVDYQGGKMRFVRSEAAASAAA